jgi:hypothetical protein
VAHSDNHPHSDLDQPHKMAQLLLHYPVPFHHHLKQRLRYTRSP